MEPISKQEKIEKIADALKVKVFEVMDEIKALAFKHLDTNQDQEVADVDIEKLLKESEEPFAQEAFKLLFDKEASSKSIKPEKRVLFLGLEGSGKTTALYLLNRGENIMATPTSSFNVESVYTKSVNLVCWDVGGESEVRPLWSNYYPGTHVVFYFVDGSNQEKIKESAEKFRELLGEYELEDAAFVIFVTKSDKSEFDAEKVKTELGVSTLSQPHRVYSVSVMDSSFKKAFTEAMDWLAEQWNISK